MVTGGMAVKGGAMVGAWQGVGVARGRVWQEGEGQGRMALVGVRHSHNMADGWRDSLWNLAPVTHLCLW